jgi:hypothetical protein
LDNVIRAKVVATGGVSSWVVCDISYVAEASRTKYELLESAVFRNALQRA